MALEMVELEKEIRDLAVIYDMNDIKNFDTFTRIEPIHKGWSKDKKFYVETNADEKLLIRVSNISEYEVKKTGV